MSVKTVSRTICRAPGNCKVCHGQVGSSSEEQFRRRAAGEEHQFEVLVEIDESIADADSGAGPVALQVTANEGLHEGRQAVSLLYNQGLAKTHRQLQGSHKPAGAGSLQAKQARQSTLADTLRHFILMACTLCIQWTGRKLGVITAWLCISTSKHGTKHKFRTGAGLVSPVALSARDLSAELDMSQSSFG